MPSLAFPYGPRHLLPTSRLIGHRVGCRAGSQLISRMSGPQHPMAPAREAPASTRAALERVNPLLACAVGKWLRARGRAVKPRLTDEQRRNLRMCFKLMDADGSGAIDAREMGAAFHLLGLSVSRREVQEMLAAVDKDGSGEVEFLEFLEIMTLQLARLAQQKEEAGRQHHPPPAAAAPGGGAGAGAGEGEGDGAATGDGAAAAAAAAVLPFDVVATAYRRKKLMEALQQDNKQFVLQVAEAEEEERRRAAAEAEQQAAERQRRASAAADAAAGVQAVSGGGGSRASKGGVSPLGLLEKQQPRSHGSFLETLSREERRIIEVLSRKYRDCWPEEGEEGEADQCDTRAQAAARRAHLGGSPPPHRSATFGARTAPSALALPLWSSSGSSSSGHLAALRRGLPAASPPRLAASKQNALQQQSPHHGGVSSSAASPPAAQQPALLQQPDVPPSQQLQHKPWWRAEQRGAAARTSPPPAQTAGLQLPSPQFSSGRLEG